MKKNYFLFALLLLLFSFQGHTNSLSESKTSIIKLAFLTVIPVFIQFESYCQYAVVPDLPSTSLNGNSGTSIETGIFEYEMHILSDSNLIGIQKGIISVNPNATITGNLSICLPGPTTTQLTGSGIPAATNPWTSLNPAVATVNNTGLVTSVSFGVTTITYANNLGENVSVNVYVSTFPTITSPSGSFTTCAAGTLQLAGSLFPNTNTPWTSANNAIATVDNTGLVTGVAGGTVDIIYTNLGGCTVSKTITINPLLTPTISFGATTSNQITINWSPVLGAATYVVVYSINGGSWALGTTGNILTYSLNGLSPGDTVNFCVTPSGPVGVCFAAECVTSSTNVNCDGTNIPNSPTLASTQPTCTVSTGSITINGVSGLTYNLDGGTYSSTINYFGLSAGNHTITAKNALGCVSPAAVFTINSQPPTPTAPIVNVIQPTCASSTGSIMIEGIDGHTFSLDGGPYTSTLLYNGLSAGGLHTITARNPFGCVSSPTTVTIGQPSGGSTLYLTSAPPTAFQSLCINTSITPIVYTVGNGATGATLVSGSVPSGIQGIFNQISGTFTVNGIVTESGTFSYSIATTGGCGLTTLSGTIIVNPTVNNLFCDASQTIAPNSILFDWSPVAGVTNYNYTYAINGGTTVNGSTPISHYEVFGVLSGQSVFFTVSVSETGCQGSISTICGALSNADFEKNKIQYFPNPVNGILNITNLKTTSNIEILNTIGQQIYNKEITSNDTQIDMSLFTNGIYIIKATSENQAQTLKVIKK